MSAYTEYNFGTTARRYEQQQEPLFQVVPGGAREPEVQSVSSTVAKAVKILAVVVIVFAVLGAVRITLGSATIAAALEYRDISGAIKDARIEGSTLEVEKSTLSNPGRIKAEAANIGMATPATTAFIDLSGDIVVTDEAGNLLLSGSAAAAAEAEQG
ncbi:cell division protein FtsL [Adlercreutzia murintestinalis]|uniref:cell division protein FtsL n=1 Tax=Adlercreutzia murintestinalis TaxID=2941325 RepID=UPI002040FC71|nr:cell division protein FtsL [Adlercreutzia murintestinalis]